VGEGGIRTPLSQAEYSINIRIRGCGSRLARFEITANQMVDYQTSNTEIVDHCCRRGCGDIGLFEQRNNNPLQQL
jgi:hypothetical protein